jgi:hypothetical protein
MGMMLVWVAAHHELTARQANVNHHVKELALAMMLVRRFHSHATADNVLGETFEFHCVRASG